MKLLVFAASHRKQSINRTLATIAAGFAKARGAEIHFPEYGEFDMPIYDDETFNKKLFPEAATRFVKALKESDGFILSSPEYNWSFPGSLKNIIDWTSVVYARSGSPNPFVGKTALLLSASPSLRGGAQGLVQLKVPLESLGVFVYPRIFTLSWAAESFDGEKGFKEPKLTAELDLLVAQFLDSTRALQRPPQAK